MKLIKILITVFTCLFMFEASAGSFVLGATSIESEKYRGIKIILAFHSNVEDKMKGELMDFAKEKINHSCKKGWQVCTGIDISKIESELKKYADKKE